MASVCKKLILRDFSTYYFSHILHITFNISYDLKNEINIILCNSYPVLMNCTELLVNHNLSFLDILKVIMKWNKDIQIQLLCDHCNESRAQLPTWKRKSKNTRERIQGCSAGRFGINFWKMGSVIEITCPQVLNSVNLCTLVMFLGYCYHNTCCLGEKACDF